MKGLKVLDVKNTTSVLKLSLHIMYEIYMQM